MIQTVVLSEDEYSYLKNVLLQKEKDILDKLHFIKKGNQIKVELEEVVAYDIRELANNIVALHFDENYKPTREGWIIEHLIDKFFFD